jgi:Phosphodiester glycosidase
MPRGTRIIVVLAAIAAGVGASLALRSAPEPPPSAPPSPLADAGGAAAPPSGTGAEIVPELTTITDDDAFRLLVFPVRVAGARFRVVDLGMTRDLARTLAETGASLVVNGGFFDGAERPEGLVISEGALLSPWSAALGGGVVTIAGGRATLAPAEGSEGARGLGPLAAPSSKGFVAPPGADLAIQARPRLVVDGGSNIARDDGRTAERTALCVHDQGRALEVIVARGEAPGAGPTLALLAEMLASRGCEGALNLDGGPSTGVAWTQGGEVRTLAPRGPVRHAIAIWAP